jgi:type II secretory pathway pseudopilin PulG
MALQSNKKLGMTLIELLVASILTGIIMIGIASFSFSIKSQQNAANRTSTLTAKVNSAINYIKRDASKAIGDAIAPGIWCHAGGGSPANGNACSRLGADQLFICFRIPDNNDPPTITDYSDDSWSCYYQDNVGSNPDNMIYKCGDEFSSAGAPDYIPSGYANCVDDDDTFTLVDTTNEDFASIIYDSGRISCIEITINALKDKTIAYNPITNPGYDITANINPKSQSR